MNASSKMPMLHPQPLISPISLPGTGLALTIALLLAGGVLFNLTPLDLWVSGHIADGLNGFPLRANWLADRMLHYYAGKFTGAMALALILFNFKQWLFPSINIKLIQAGRYLMWSWACSILLIGLLKSVTTLPCPWDLVQFGGNDAYLRLYQLFSPDYAVGRCFPGAHSTGGYGLLGLAFIALIYGRSLWLGLLPGLALGLLYSVTQIVRGAHFVSHELFTIAICLSFAALWAQYFLLPRISREPMPISLREISKLSEVVE